MKRNQKEPVVVPFVERNRQSEKIWVGLQCHQLRKVLNSNTEVKTKNSKCWYTTEKRNKKKIVQRNEKYVFGGTRKKGKTDLVVSDEPIITIPIQTRLEDKITDKPT